MKGIVITLCTVGLLACNNPAGKQSADTGPAKDSLLQHDRVYPDENKADSNEYYHCDFDQFINDPATPKLAKDIYLDNEWHLNKDDEALALLDSLRAKDKSSRPFYFKVVTKSNRKADGYFSEGLGLAGYEFVLNNTREFAAYFDNKACHTDNDLATWAEIIFMEFMISAEGAYDQPVVDDYLNKLEVNCKNGPATQKETINRFGLILKEKWSAFLKRHHKMKSIATILCIFLLAGCGQAVPDKKPAAKRDTYTIVLKTALPGPEKDPDTGEQYSTEIPGAIDTASIEQLNEPLKALAAFYAAMGGTMCSGQYCELTTALGLGAQGSDRHKDLIKKYFPNDKVAETVIKQDCYLRPSGASAFSDFEFLTITDKGDTVVVDYNLMVYNRGATEWTKGPDVYLVKNNTFEKLERNLWTFADQ